MTGRLTRRALIRGAASAASIGALGVPVVSGGRGASAGRDGTGRRRDASRAAAGSDWPSFALDAANTGYAPDRSAPVGDATVAWTVETDDWVQGSPVVVDGTVFFGSDDGAVYAVDAADGTVQWSHGVGGGVSSPAVADGTVYVGGLDGNLYALAAADGSEQWTAGTELFDPFGSPTTVVDGTVYAGRHDGNLYALAAADGTVEWTADLDGLVEGAPAVADGTVYAGSDAGVIAAVDTADGSERWTVEAEDGVWPAPAVGDGTVYVGADDGRLRALDAADGTERWTVVFDSGIRTSPVVAGTSVYVATTEGIVTARDVTDGSERWSNRVTGAFASPVVVGDRLYVGSGIGEVTAMRTDSGAVDWAFQAEDAVSTALAVADGRLLFGSFDGRLYALEPAPPTRTATPTPTPTGETTGDTPTGETTGDTPTGETTGDTPTGETTDDTRTGRPTTRLPTTRPPTTSRGATAGTQGTGETASASTGSGETGTPAGDPDGSSGDAFPVGLLALALGSLGVGGLGGGYLWTRRGGDDATEPPAAAAGDGDGTDGSASQGGVDLGDVSLTGDDPSLGWDDGDVSALSLGAAGPDDGPLGDDGPDAGPASGGDGRDPSLRVAGPSADWVRDDWPVADTVPGEPALDVDYEDLERGTVLGSGGQGDVYRATLEADAGTREFALKELRVDPRGGTDADEVVRRAEVWANLADHDHVVDVVDWGREPRPWLLTEYVGGGHLGRRAGTLDVEQALWVAVGVARAVRHAHRRGVAHFDLKPANVLFERVPNCWDVPKVADWGLSRQLLTHSGTVEGFTPRYAAPEQVCDGFGDTDERTDVYSLGAVCHTLVTGQPPYGGDPAKVVSEIVADSPPPRPSAVADVPSGLDDIVATAMATEKRDRYESVLYMRDDLIALAEDV